MFWTDDKREIRRRKLYRDQQLRRRKLYEDSVRLYKKLIRLERINDALMRSYIKDAPAAVNAVQQATKKLPANGANALTKAMPAQEAKQLANYQNTAAQTMANEQEGLKKILTTSPAPTTNLGDPNREMKRALVGYASGVGAVGAAYGIAHAATNRSEAAKKGWQTRKRNGTDKNIFGRNG